MKLTPTAICRRRTSPEPGARIDANSPNKDLRATVARNRDLDALGCRAGSRGNRRAIHPRGERTCSQRAPKSGEARLDDLLAHETLEPHALLRRWFEGGLPFHEAGIVARYWPQAHTRHVFPERRRRLQNAVAEASLCVGQKQELLANVRAILEPKVADAANLIARFAILNGAR